MDKRLTDHRRDRYAQNPNANIDDCGKQTCQNDCSQRIFLFSHFYFPLKRSPIFSIIAESRHHNQHQTEGRGAFGSLRLLQTRSPSQSSQQTSNLFRTRDLKKGPMQRDRQFRNSSQAVSNDCPSKFRRLVRSRRLKSGHCLNQSPSKRCFSD